MACDVCGNNDKRLEPLREIYATKEVRQICPDCEKVINKELRKIQTATTQIQIGWFKNMLNQLRKGVKV